MPDSDKLCEGNKAVGGRACKHWWEGWELLEKVTLKDLNETWELVMQGNNCVASHSVTKQYSLKNSDIYMEIGSHYYF